MLASELRRWLALSSRLTVLPAHPTSHTVWPHPRDPGHHMINRPSLDRMRMHLEFQPGDEPVPTPSWTFPPNRSPLSCSSYAMSSSARPAQSSTPNCATSSSNTVTNPAVSVGLSTPSAPPPSTAPPAGHNQHQTRVEMNHVEEAAGGHGQRREQQGAPRVGDIGVPEAGSR